MTDFREGGPKRFSSPDTLSWQIYTNIDLAPVEYILLKLHISTMAAFLMNLPKPIQWWVWEWIAYCIGLLGIASDGFFLQ